MIIETAQSVARDLNSEQDVRGLVSSLLGLTAPRLPLNAKPKDLVPHLYGKLKTKRIRKKFLKDPTRYCGYLPKGILTEYVSNRLAADVCSVLHKPVWDWSRLQKCLIVEKEKEDVCF